MSGGKGLFVTAAGTDVGKTYVSALMVKKLKKSGYDAGYYKPVLSGAEKVNGRLVPGDARYVCETSGIPYESGLTVSYMYERAVSPHLAARLEGNPADESKILADYEANRAKYSYLTVEGCGGIACPLRPDDFRITIARVIKALKIPLVIVAESGLGAVNAAVLTAEYALSAGLDVRGFFMNRFRAASEIDADNAEVIERMTGVPVIARIPDGAEDMEIDADALARLYA